jgi:hypothetical protein
MNKYLKVGSDPEAFLRDKKGKLVSAIKYIPGTKYSPHKTNHGYIQHDNILAEFNSIPADNKLDFINNHRLIIKDLEEVLKPLDLKLDFIASSLCTKSLLSDPLAQLAGCEPDFDVWNWRENVKVDYSKTNKRAAGGHLHISFDQAEGSYENRAKFVKALDLVLGVPSVLLDDDIDRRSLYGKAGSFRPKDTLNEDPYDGVEYRTLSNFWLRSEGLMGWVFDSVKRVYDNLEELSEIAIFEKAHIVQCINQSDKNLAEIIMTRNNLYA